MFQKNYIFFLFASYNSLILFQKADNYVEFKLFFHLPSEWIDQCVDVELLIDFITLSAGVKKYGIFSNTSRVGNHYFLEHMGIVAEIKTISDFTFLLQRRPDIPTIQDDNFKINIINGELLTYPNVNDDPSGSHLKINFHESTNGQKMILEEMKKIEEVEDVKAEVDVQLLNLPVKKEPDWD